MKRNRESEKFASFTFIHGKRLECHDQMSSQKLLKKLKQDSGVPVVIIYFYFLLHFHRLYLSFRKILDKNFFKDLIS
jgi:hypothetical protein